jgi:hypothetical protein
MASARTLCDNSRMKHNINPPPTRGRRRSECVRALRFVRRAPARGESPPVRCKSAAWARAPCGD